VDHVRFVLMPHWFLAHFSCSPAAAMQDMRLCPAHDELRDHLRPRTHVNEPVFCADQLLLVTGG